MRKNIINKKVFSLLVLAFFVVLASFSIYSLVTGVISFGEVNDAWDGESVALEFSSGNGSSENPYLISNPSEFILFKNLIEGETSDSYKDKYYTLTNDINLGNHSIKAIGVQDKIFSGHFNGNGYSISNIRIDEGQTIEGVDYYSLFSKTYNASIENLNISNIDIKVNSNRDSFVSLLIGDMKADEDSIIDNISINEFNIDSSLEEVNINTSIISNNIGGNITIKNIVLNGSVTGKDVTYYNSLDSINTLNIISNINYPFVIDGSNINNYININDGFDFNSILLSLNDNVSSSIIWVFENDKFYLKHIVLEEVIDSPSSKSFSFSIRSMDITIHDTGIDNSNHAIYINNLDRDYNYYMGLNYTEIRNTNGTIPNGTNQNIYSNSNLATIYIRYSSADINDSSTYGSVSVSEDIRDYYYYGRYPVVNGYVIFDLIDNPWANRPTGRAFNGWVTDYTGATISLDMDTYVRSVKIPVSDISNPISITFYSSWTLATTVTSSNNVNNLKSVGMTELTSSSEDLTQYYISQTVNYNNRFPNNNDLWDLDGNKITARSYCQVRTGCTYLIKNTNNSYISTNHYYSVTPLNNNYANVLEITPHVYPIDYYTSGVGAGYFIKVSNGSENVYSGTGEKLSSCNNSNNCYKLLQYADGELTPGTAYYYLTTRDTNIYAPSTTNTIYTSDISVSRPMTITGINGGVDNSNNRLIQLDSNWTISSDLRIEFIRFYTSNTTTNVTSFSTGYTSYIIIGNFNNIKIGRGLKRYNTNLTATSFVGGSSNSASSLSRYTTIIESGFYQNGSAVGYSSAVTHRVEANVTLGNDYDRVDDTNDALIVYYCYAGTWASNLYNSSSNNNTYDTPAISTVVKSGSFGTNKGDYAAGIYAGGRGSGTHYALRKVTVEGGSIYNLIGGPMSSDSRASKNDVIINVVGGTMDMIFGGAGVSNTVGNRILNITGGTVNYGILGGSNAYNRGTNTNNPFGKIDGDTLLYIGGNVTVGTQDDSLYNISSGDVFGAGNGRSGELDVGSVNNSNVIIGPSATINGDVYGGGNFGAVGGSTSGNGSYGGGNGSNQQDESGAYKDNTIDQNIRYFGSSPDNYIQFNGELYRIIGLFNNISTSNGSKNLVRIVKNNSLGTHVWGDTNMSTVETNTSTETSSGGWSTNTYNYTNYYKNYYNFFVKNDDSKSNIYNYLNTTYYNGLNSTYRDYIEEVNWGLGSTNSVNQSASSFYTAERGTGVVNYLSGINQTSNGNSSYSALFKVGLFYPSDFGFANKDDNCLNNNLGSYTTNCRNNNWMRSMTNAWTITPSTSVTSVTKEYQVSRTGNFITGYTYTMNRYYHVSNSNFILGANVLELKDIYYTNNDNDANNYYNTSQVYPSFYLKDNVTISSGTGTSSDPYIIGSSDVTINSILLDLVAENPVVIEPVEDNGVYHEANDYQARTKINIIGGSIHGSIYGAGNSNGAGNIDDDDNIAIAKVEILMNGGSVSESIYGGANAEGKVYGDVLIQVINGSVGESIYGGGKGGYDNDSDGTYVMRDVDVAIGSNETTSLTIGDSVYGGSAFGTVNGIEQGEEKNNSHVRVTINNGVISGSVFGGGEGDNTYVPNEYGNVFVHINGGNITSVFGGNDSRGEPSGYDAVYLNGGTIGNAFGGGNNTGQNSSDIRLQGATITGNLYGGSNASGNVNITQVSVSSGSVVEVYGGNNLGGTAGDTYVSITGGSISTAIYGGGKQAESDSSHVTITGCTVPDVYGGGRQAGLSEGSIVTLTNATAGTVYGGSNVLGTVASSDVTVSGSTLTALFGGNNAGGTTTTTSVEVTNSDIGEVYGGGNNAPSTSSYVKINSGDIDYLYGGGNQAGVTNTNVEITTGTFINVFGGSNRQGNIATSRVEVSGGTFNSLYGGNNLGGVTSAATTVATGGTFQNIYGGGSQADVGSTTLSLDSITSGNVYGGCRAADVSGNTSLDIDDSTISGNVFGGGDEGEVDGNTTVFLTDVTVGGNVYAGGNLGNVGGNSSVTIDGDTTVGSSSSEAPNGGCVFGSGNAASTGSTSNPGVATVNIVGGEIFGNVYGGPKMAVVYGVTNTNIGTSAVNINGLDESNIIIHGTVFGGGESNASGSETYDYTFISVTNGIDVNINGTGYINNNHQFVINGSIFGSGNASSSAGDSNITIKNLGSSSLPNKAVSIQRATNLVIDASVIELSGTTDRTNEYSDILYSFNMIDKMVIKNGTTLLLKHNANLLKELYSGVDDNGVLKPATVTIENGTVTRNVDNRIYMIPGQNLHVTVNQSATAYGRVTGMTFFGMYTTNEAGTTYRFGLYDPIYTYGSTGNAGLEIVGGSYVIGLHHTGHDITKDGFYTNVLNETYTEIITEYIDPSPIGQTGYRWIVGFEAINYTVPLTISKYSSLGTYELSLIDFTEGDSIFTVIGFDSTQLDPDLELVDSSIVPRVGTTVEEANGKIGLAMKVETQEWTGTGTTKFYSTNGGEFAGDTEYHTDSRSLAPSLMFYSYHAKNFSRTGDLGDVIITMEVAVPKNAIEYTIKYVTITVELEARNYGDGAFYDASITYDKKYEMPAATSVNITNQSQFTAYFSLTEFFNNFQSVYGQNNTNYHVLTTTTPLPVGTMITMLDYGGGRSRPEYYYYRVTQAIYDASVIECNTVHQATYRLSDFIKMDSTSTNNTYDDATENLLYYTTASNFVDEEFIFIIDFKETTTTGEHLNNHISFELRNSDGWSVINVVGIRDSVMYYNLYDTSNVVLQQTFTDVDEYLYYNVPDLFHYSVEVLYNETLNRESVIDTNYEYSRMGLNVIFYDRTGEAVSSSLLVGTSVHVGNREYFADGDGVFRIKLADKVSNIERDADVVVGRKLPSGSYTIRYVLFASSDGLHNSTYHNSVTQSFNVSVVSADNYVYAECQDYTKLVYGETGLNHHGDNYNNYTVKTYSNLTNANYRVEIYKRDTTDEVATTYTSVPFNTLFVNNYNTASGNEIYINMGNSTEKVFTFNLVDNLTSGTYKVVFRMYDTNQLIDEDVKYVIVQKTID